MAIVQDWVSSDMVLPCPARRGAALQSYAGWSVDPSLPLPWWAARRASDLPPGFLVLSSGMNNWDSPKCLNTRIEINVPSLLGTLTIHYSKHLPKVK